jgi:LCP family protein required for cell wall assembly
MAPDDKPYRVYKGGRVKGKVPAVSGTPRPKPSSASSRSSNGTKSPKPRGPSRTRRINWRHVTLIGLLVLVVVFVVWAVTGFLAFQSGVSDANKRFAHERGAKAALTSGNGFLLSHPTTILLLGTDSSTASGRSGDRHADSIMLVRTDPSHHRLSYLSIPRDLYVTIPRLGNAKINAAYQAGGLPLAIDAVKAFTGVGINHVVVVDFNNFKDLINAEGGITVNVPEEILSNRFDCPYKTQARCQEWKGWRFHRGSQHMTGDQALIYSRIRENQLNPGESDLTRGARQQAVAQAATAKLTSPSTLIDLPFDGSKLMKPLTTDLSTWQLMELGWVKFRASGSHTLYCRLGGDPTTLGGQSVLLPSEDNAGVLAMWLGRSAAQPPTTTYGPGCRTGHPLQ